MKTVKLSSGYEMPIVGLGTWRSEPEEIDRAVQAALECGYRHIDTAFNYKTEEPIGKTIKNWIQAGKGTREELFITTKLPNVGNRAKDVEKFLNMSLERLQMSYVDLYLIHMPFSFIGDPETHIPLQNEDGTFQLDPNNDLIDTWKKMEDQVKIKKVKSIGLSNFNSEQIERICKVATIKPAVLQIELHAYHQQEDLVKKCKELNIAVTAYSPLGSPGALDYIREKYNAKPAEICDLLTHSTVKCLAEKYKKSSGQILLRHIVQKGIIVIPKSCNPDRIKSNIDIFDFELNDQDMELLSKIDRGEKGKIFDFLFMKGAEKHPEYPFKDKLN